MKKIFLLIPLIIILFSSSCKYDDGPLISFRSKMNRFYGDHVLVKYTVDGEDSLSQLNNKYGLNFHFSYNEQNNDNVIIIDGNPLNNFVSSFTLIDKNKKINISGGTLMLRYNPLNYHDLAWEIILLKKNNIKLRVIDNNKEYFMELN